MTYNVNDHLAQWLSLFLGQVLEDVTVLFLQQFKTYSQVMILQHRRIIVHEGQLRVWEKRLRVRRKEEARLTIYCTNYISSALLFVSLCGLPMSSNLNFQFYTKLLYDFRNLNEPFSWNFHGALFFWSLTFQNSAKVHQNVSFSIPRIKNSSMKVWNNLHPSSCVQVVTNPTGPSISHWGDFTGCVGGTRELCESQTHVAHLTHASIACENRPIDRLPHVTTA